MRLRLSTLGLVNLVASVTTFAVGAAEKTAPISAAVDLARLAIELDLFDQEAHRARLASQLTGLAVGGVMLPTGLVLLHRTDGVSQALVVGMIVGGSAQLVAVPFGFLPTQMEEIRDRLRRRIAENADPKTTIQLIEADWQDAADHARHKRRYAGATVGGIGVASLTTGLVFLLANEGVFGLSRKSQYTWGGVLTGTGVSMTTLGTRFLLEWSAEETAWEAYRTMRPEVVTPTTLSLGVVPMNGGALAFVGTGF